MTLTEEQKQIAEAVKAKAKEEAGNAEPDAEKKKADSENDEPIIVDEDNSEDDDKEKNTDEEVLTTEDYAEMLKKEREAREKAEKEIADKAFQEREAKRKNKETKGDDDDGEDKPLTERRLTEILQSERQATQKTLAEKEIRAIAEKMSGSEEETNLIVEIHKNRTFPSTLTLQEQVEEAWAIANRKKMVTHNKEITRALKSKETANKTISTGNRQTTPVAEGKLSNQDARAIKESGMVWDGVKRAYKKPLGNGKTFYFYDPKTKRRWKE